MDWPKQTRGLTPATDTESASDIFRADKVSKSLVAHFWGSKLLMITVRLSARHSAPAEPLPVVKVTDPTGRGGGGDERLRHRQGALNIMVYMRHQWLESKKSNQELRIKAQWCWMFWDWNVQHNQNTAQTQTETIHLHILAQQAAFIVHIQTYRLTFKWAAL